MEKLFVIIVLLLMGCGQKKKKVDLIVFNSNTYTVDGDFSKIEAFAVDGGKFLAIGTTDEILGKYTSRSNPKCRRENHYPWSYRCPLPFLRIGYGPTSS